MRLFVALDVDDDVVAAVDSATSSLRERYGQLRWTRPDAWHLTLAFLGDVGEDDRPRVASVVGDTVDEVAPGPVDLALGPPGHFNRRVLWVAVSDQPAGAVATIGGALQHAVAAAGLPVDTKPVHPHLTLARTRGRARLPRNVLDDVPYVEGAWTAEAAVLYRSHLGTGGSRYEPLARFPL